MQNSVRLQTGCVYRPVFALYSRFFDATENLASRSSASEGTIFGNRTQIVRKRRSLLPSPFTNPFACGHHNNRAQHSMDSIEAQPVEAAHGGAPVVEAAPATDANSEAELLWSTVHTAVSSPFPRCVLSKNNNVNKNSVLLNDALLRLLAELTSKNLGTHSSLPPTAVWIRRFFKKKKIKTFGVRLIRRLYRLLETEDPAIISWNEVRA